MDPLFLGSHSALDFLNTALAPEGRPIETIGDGKALVRWMVTAGLIEDTEGAKLLRRFGFKAMDQVAARARRLRDWARAWLIRWRSDPGGDYRSEIATLNKLLSRQAIHRAVISTDGSLNLSERIDVESEEGLLGLLALQLAALVTREDAHLIKSCAGEGCTLWFLDRTKAHRRLFCSATACGNRARVAAFRKRARP